MSADVDRGAEIRRIMRRERRRRWVRPVLALTLVAAFVAFVVDGVLDQSRWRTVDFRPLPAEDAATVLRVEGGDCGVELRLAEVTEAGGHITILLEQQGSSSDGCGAGSVTVQLDDVIGDREVRDAANGRRWARGADPDHPLRWAPASG